MRIVPEARLLFWVGAVFVPFSLLATVNETGMAIAAIGIGALLVAALVDALRGLAALDGIGVELPAVVRLAKDRAGEMEVRVRNSRQDERRLRVGFALPEELGTATEAEVVLLPAGTEWSVINWSLRPAERGKHLVERAYLEGLSPFGL